MIYPDENSICVECDECPNSEIFDKSEAELVLEKLIALGWEITLYEEDQFHTCPSCVQPPTPKTKKKGK